MARGRAWLQTEDGVLHDCGLRTVADVVRLSEEMKLPISQGDLPSPLDVKFAGRIAGAALRGADTRQEPWAKY